jgi:hypothetical protein
MATQEPRETKMMKPASGNPGPKNLQISATNIITSRFQIKANHAIHELFVYGNLFVMLKIIVNIGERKRLTSNTNTIVKKNMTASPMPCVNNM